jgi:UvrD/REP helicase N-terminal domain
MKAGGRAIPFQRISFLLALLGQHTETWLPRCGPSGQLNGVEAVAGPDGLTVDLITLQERWEDYLDRQDILDFATIQRRFQQRQAAVVPQLDHVFVDEFQDTNPIQFAIHLAWLGRPETRLTVVGDDDQALYRFRLPVPRFRHCLFHRPGRCLPQGWHRVPAGET